MAISLPLFFAMPLTSFPALALFSLFAPGGTGAFAAEAFVGVAGGRAVAASSRGGALTLAAAARSGTAADSPWRLRARSKSLTHYLGFLTGGDPMQTLGVIFLLAVMIALVALIVYVESARRNIPISYASRRVGNQVYSGKETSLPLKINMGGVIPVIFASSVLAMPQTLFSAFPPGQPGTEGYDPNATWTKIYNFFQQFHGGDPYYEFVYIGLIVLFTFFYITIIFNTDEVSDNLRKHGGFVPGIRPGAPTADYLNTILTRLTAVGALYLAFVSFVPQVLLSGFKVARLPFFGERVDAFLTATPGLSWIPTGLGYQFFFGGTSLLIIVGVAMDTVAQIEAQLVMRNYEGFLGAGRLRGRRG